MLDLPNPLDWIDFSLWLSALLHCHGKKILRLKGIIKTDDDKKEQWITLSGVQHLIYPPQHLEHPPANGKSQLVIITDGLSPARIIESFQQYFTVTS